MSFCPCALLEDLKRILGVTRGYIYPSWGYSYLYIKYCFIYLFIYCNPCNPCNLNIFKFVQDFFFLHTCFMYMHACIYFHYNFNFSLGLHGLHGLHMQ